MYAIFVFHLCLASTGTCHIFPFSFVSFCPAPTNPGAILTLTLPCSSWQAPCVHSSSTALWNARHSSSLLRASGALALHAVICFWQIHPGRPLDCMLLEAGVGVSHETVNNRRDRCWWPTTPRAWHKQHTENSPSSSVEEAYLLVPPLRGRL